MQGERTYAKGSFVLVFTTSFKGSEKIVTARVLIVPHMMVPVEIF